MDVECTWILWQGENCRQFRLLFPLPFIGQFIHILWEGRGWGILPRHKFHFNRNQDPSNNKLIYVILVCEIECTTNS